MPLPMASLLPHPGHLPLPERNYSQVVSMASQHWRMCSHAKWGMLKTIRMLLRSGSKAWAARITRTSLQFHGYYNDLDATCGLGKEHVPPPKFSPRTPSTSRRTHVPLRFHPPFLDTRCPTKGGGRGGPLLRASRQTRRMRARFVGRREKRGAGVRFIG